jgi:hypothetical protein
MSLSSYWKYHKLSLQTDILQSDHQEPPESHLPASKGEAGVGQTGISLNPLTATNPLAVFLKQIS